MDYKVLRQNDKISLDVDPEKPKIESEDEFVENPLEAVSLERRSTILEGKSKYHNFCKFKENLVPCEVE